MNKLMFSVGEEVIHLNHRKMDVIQSLDVNSGTDRWQCTGCGKAQQRYWLVRFRGSNGGVCECVLRKKPDPGMDFNELMTELKHSMDYTVSFTHDELYEVMQKKEAPLKLKRTV